MSTKVLTLSVAALAMLALPACTQRATDLPPGKYESTSKSVDSQGTAHEKTTTTNVEVDKYGNKKATTETEKSSDPKGLFNKSTSKTSTTTKENRY